MKKTIYLLIVVFSSLFVGVLPVHADGHWHGGGHGHGFNWGVRVDPGWGPWWWGPPCYSYYPYYPYYAPSAVIQEQPSE